jgi:hypothetical protein
VIKQLSTLGHGAHGFAAGLLPAAALLCALFAPGVQSAAAQAQTPAVCADLSADAVAYLCSETSDGDYVNCIRRRDLLVADMRKGITPETPQLVIDEMDAVAASDCGGPDAAAPASPSQPAALPTPAADAIDPTSPDDVTACLPTDNIGALLGQPTRFHAGDGPQNANFTGPGGATLQIERAPSDGPSVYQQHLDEGLSHTDWQIAGVNGLGDKAFAANRGGDSRSLVILDGDTAWLLHMDGVPAGAGFAQLGTIAQSILNTCP